MAQETTVDENLLKETRNQIQKLVDEVNELAESDIQPQEFYAEFLSRVVAATAANGGALWMLDPRGALKLQHQIEFQQSGLLGNRQRAGAHDALLGLMLQAAAPEVIPPGATVEGVPNAGNPTSFALILAPVELDKRVVGLVELLMDPGRKALTQNSTKRFLAGLCDVASHYLKNRQVRQLVSQQRMWNQLEAFTHAAHQSLDLKETCYAVANEGKRLVGCDRLSVALKLNAAARVLIEAVSGQEVVEQKSNLVRELTRLCKVVIQSGEDLVYSGHTENFPPEIREALEIYVDESGSKAIAVTLLHRPETETNKERTPFGCLVAEQIGDEMAPTDMHARCEVIARHASTALWNAQEHHKIFAAPVLKALGEPWRVFRGRTLAKILAVLGLILGTILAMAFWPWRLTVEGRGSILPEIRHNTYAPAKGVITATYFDHGDTVRGPRVDSDGEPQPGDLLLKIESKELEAELKKMLAEKSDAMSQMASLRAQINSSSTRPEDRPRLIGEFKQAEIKLLGAEEQIAIIEDQLAMMEIHAPCDGIVTTWEVRRNFLNRPVEMGQELVQVAATDGEWVLEVQVPDHDMGPVLAAQARLRAALAPVAAARERLEEACRPGIDSGSAAAIEDALDALRDALRQVQKSPARDLTEVGPALDALTGFAKAVARLLDGGGDPAAAREAKAGLDQALDRASTLSAYFVSATDPQHRYPGYVRRIATTAETKEQQHSTKVTVGFSEAVRREFLSRNQALRPGAEVRARINCGDANMAYALMRDVVHFWHENVTFRWPFLP
ncbi:MAG: hypothetical protein KatS3mg108_2996 [Isosphaeraceae bacterium]|jgi:hypothetical protein|nr:MAG: hypothetical protein KatS3mg108_2996 [Isosphaeraceae bacterium]